MNLRFMSYVCPYIVQDECDSNIHFNQCTDVELLNILDGTDESYMQSNILGLDGPWQPMPLQIADI